MAGLGKQRPNWGAGAFFKKKEGICGKLRPEIRAVRRSKKNPYKLMVEKALKQGMQSGNAFRSELELERIVGHMLKRKYSWDAVKETLFEYIDAAELKPPKAGLFTGLRPEEFKLMVKRAVYQNMKNLDIWSAEERKLLDLKANP